MKNVCKTLFNYSQTKFVAAMLVLLVFLTQFVVWLIFRVTHLTFRPQNRDRHVATSGHYSFLNILALFQLKPVLRGWRPSPTVDFPLYPPTRCRSPTPLLPPPPQPNQPVGTPPPLFPPYLDTEKQLLAKNTQTHTTFGNFFQDFWKRLTFLLVLSALGSITFRVR